MKVPSLTTPLTEAFGFGCHAASAVPEIGSTRARFVVGTTPLFVDAKLPPRYTCVPATTRALMEATFGCGSQLRTAPAVSKAAAPLRATAPVTCVNAPPA